MIEHSFSDIRIQQFQNPADKVTKLLKSPAGVVVGRTFSMNFDPTISANVYSIIERRQIVEQIRIVLRDFYVHLEMKQAQYGFDPLRALARLEPILEELSDSEFLQSVVQVITRTRDRHLAFLARSPNGVSAILPFLIELCWSNDEEMYVVTKITDGSETQHIKVGAIVTHWNGIPIDRYVRLNANLFDGGNESASIARSLEFLTQRPLSRFALPIESWVSLRFLVEDQSYEQRFDWRGFDVGQVPAIPAIGRNIIGFGGDLELMQSHATKRSLFAPQSFDESLEAGFETETPGLPQIKGQTNSFQFGKVSTERGTFGYIRLYDFQADNVDDIAVEIIKALEQLPRNGLIIDIRRNSGGYIAAGERLLQLFTPKEITPSRFQFRVTEGTRHMMSATPYFETWRPSIDEAFRTGEPFSQGYPIEGTDEDANQIGQRYFGPVVLVTDALAFSTADMFAAGFIDHGIGKVICIDKNMAAAGGNNWRFDILRLFLPDFQIDAGFKPQLDSGVVSDELRTTFRENGVMLTNKAVIAASGSEYDGIVWKIDDSDWHHNIRHIPWIDNQLHVYPARSRFGLQQLTDDVLSFGFTIRRCIRSGKSEGRLLEDLGIQPDVIYRSTLRDVLNQNQDLLIRAALELSQLPAYDLLVEVETIDGVRSVTCLVNGITALEVIHNERHLLSFDTSSVKSVKFTVPNSVKRVVIKGYHEEQIVARRIAFLE